MKVSELIQALSVFDPDTDVVSPAEDCDFAVVTEVILDHFAPDHHQPDGLGLAFADEDGAQQFVRLCTIRHVDPKF